jgi:coenzyme F420-reducing hydrogenase gamma subunit
VARHATCIECKLRGHVCVMVAHGTPCLGPVTHDGCGALCPSYARGCYGCFGPSDAPHTEPLADYLTAHGTSKTRIRRLFSTFNTAAPAFRKEAERHGD